MTAFHPDIMGVRHMAASAHYLAAQAAFTVLEAGGNAIDAGVAGGIALGVVQSEYVSIAGVAPIILYHAETQRLHTIAGLGWWPRATRAEVFQQEHGGQIPVGVLRTVVPAAPDAWITALERWGTMGFADVAAPAIRLAADGFPCDALKSEIIAHYAPSYRRWAENAAIYLPGGQPPRPGERFRQADLGRTLQFMADQDRAAAAKGGRAAGLAAARDSFYRGDIAAGMLAHMREHGGWLAAEDLAEYRSEVGTPETGRFGDWSINTCGVWCQGPALIQLLQILEGFDLAAMGHNSPDYLHTLIEAVKLAFADREAYYGDPRFVAVPLAGLLSADYAARRRALIRPEAACPDMPPAGSAAELGAAARAPGAGPGPDSVAAQALLRQRDLDTAYICAVDRHGNVFSATPSDGSPTAPVVKGMGFVPSPRGSQSRPDPRHPCGVAPGKRPRLTPNPALAIRRDGKALIPFGTPGGDVQVQAMAQVFLNMVVFGMEPQAAIEAPRAASYSFPNSFAPFDHHPALMRIERRVPEATVAALAARGHRVELWPETTWLAGAVCTIHADREAGVLKGGADARRPGAAIGW